MKHIIQFTCWINELNIARIKFVNANVNCLHKCVQTLSWFEIQVLKFKDKKTKMTER